MPLIERIKQLLGMGTPVNPNRTFVASGGIVINGCAEVEAPNRAFTPTGGIIVSGEALVDLFKRLFFPAVFCFKFSINEVVFDHCGNRYTVIGVTGINDNNFYTVNGRCNKKLKFAENQLSSVQCPAPNLFCELLTTTPDMIIEKAERMIEEIENIVPVNPIAADICFKFSIGENVFGPCFKRHIIKEVNGQIIGQNGEMVNVYVIEDANGNQQTINENLLFSTSCQPVDQFCQSPFNKLIEEIEAAERMIDKIEKQQQLC